MLKLLRYTLATIFLAASVGCLGLWWRSYACWDLHCILTRPGWGQYIQTIDGMVIAELNAPVLFFRTYTHFSYEWSESRKNEVRVQLDNRYEEHGRFYSSEAIERRELFFPLCYPALVSALAAVGVLRLGKRFTIRSALIATAVAAVLLGTVVAL